MGKTGLLDRLHGAIALTAPHMDDCVLGCGGLFALLPKKEEFFVIYATDGMGSPEPVIPGRDRVSPDLGEVRQREALAALGSLGISTRNVHFLNLPDGKLTQDVSTLNNRLAELLDQIKPDVILTPFRYDRHPDHLALNHAVMVYHGYSSRHMTILEYFIYHHWRLLPSGDVRTYLKPDHLYELEITSVSDRKLAALQLFKSQTTRFYPWQARPNLTPELLERVSQAPEFFLEFVNSQPGAQVFDRLVPYIRIAHRLESFLKKRKDRAIALLRRGRL
jgi:LmbE family N-acetylglucosaminyl deacetylase